MVTSRPQRYRDKFQAHYTSSPEIVRYMVAKLRPIKGDFIWEPCAGAGDLIDGILHEAVDVGIRASEISEQAVVALQKKYKGHPSVEVYCEDALELGNASLFDGDLQFTRVLANPPYGAYLTPERRISLKKRYPKLYVKETYSLVLYHSLRLTGAGGRVVFIIPDTFLWLHRHQYLRRTLLTQTTIEELVLFPSKFFPGINFGYSGLCIITLVKATPLHNHRVRIIANLANPSVLLDCAEGRYPSGRCSVVEVLQSRIVARQHAELVNEPKTEADPVGAWPNLTLGDIAEVRTGFYSGNDRRWFRRAHSRVPRSKHYLNIDPSLVSRLSDPPLAGIEGQRCFIPILRGGAASFIRPTLWFVDWSLSAVREYRRSGKNPARFQNSKYYFKEGIGVPMVASARLTAALLERRLFDQGIVGIFPKDEKYMLYLFGFLNTELATRLLRKINPTANNSANYLKRLPMVLPNERELEECIRLVRKAMDETRQFKRPSEGTLDEFESFYRAIWCRPCAVDEQPGTADGGRVAEEAEAAPGSLAGG